MNGDLLQSAEAAAPRAPGAQLLHDARFFLLATAVQASFITVMAFLNSPTVLEPGHLASGLSHWKYSQFNCFVVNPPVVRLIAALPPYALGVAVPSQSEASRHDGEACACVSSYCAECIYVCAAMHWRPAIALRTISVLICMLML